MAREISYYGTGKDESEKETSYVQKIISMPGRAQLNIALLAAGIAVVLAIVCGYYAYSSEGNLTVKPSVHSSTQ